ncbi:MAG: carboxypeptidase regulatory-like domain-containing protein [Planctomycetes bacterium]|nr:carboxypeptidase regulatory-like domain-containing protein [Planctomycetota bacterium]
MQRRTILSAAAVVALVVVCVWLVAAADADPPPTIPPATPDAADRDPAAVTAARGTPAAANDAPHAPDREALAASPSPVTSAAPTTLLGRCIDPDGRALAGCTVRLWGSMSGPRRDTWLRDRPPPPWQDLERETAADGRFQFTFVPPPPFHFLLLVQQPGRVGLQASWDTFAAAARIDLGDIVLPAGVELVGVVVDPAGAPVAEAELALRPPDDAPTPRGPFRPLTYGQARTDAAGRFACRPLLLPGRYDVLLRREAGEQQIDAVEVPPGRATVDVRLVVKPPLPQPSIRGRVVDVAGQPVRRAQVRSDDGRPFSPRAETRADGTFVLDGKDATPEPIVLEVLHEAYEPARSAAPIAWGTADVELVLAPAADLAVRVTDADGAPVVDYTVRVLPRQRGRWVGNESSVRARGPFADGVAVVRGIASGEWTVLVEFPSTTGFCTMPAPITVAAGVPLRLDLRAERPTAQVVRVVTAAGTPVAGTKVQACDPIEAAFDEGTRLLDHEQLFRIAGVPRALVCSEGTTDADGRIVLQGPAGRPLGLALLGPGHVPRRVPDVRFDGQGERRIVVEAGGRVVGRLVPAAAIDELRRLAGLPPGADFPADLQPLLTLVRPAARGVERLPAPGTEPAFRIDAAGRFAVDGVPPGAWTLGIQYRRQTDRVASTRRLELTAIAVHGAATTTLDVDLGGIVPGTLTGVLVHNGIAAAGAQVQLECRHAPAVDRSPDREVEEVRTDATGAFTHIGRPGDYRAAIVRQSGRNRWRLPSTAVATVLRGETTRTTFAVWSSAVTIRLTDAAGRPAAGVTLRVDVDGQGFDLPASDGDGQIEAELPTGAAAFSTLPRALQSQAAQYRLWRDADPDGPGDPLASHRLLLAACTLAAGQPTTVDLRLPENW